MMTKETYVARRKALKAQMGSGLILLLGNNDSPCNGPYNNYFPFRQDSSFLYFYGLTRDGLMGVIDVDNDREYLFGDDIDIDDIIWFGSVESVAEMAERVGVDYTGSFSQGLDMISRAQESETKVHFLPPYRHDHQILLSETLGVRPSAQKDAASVELIKAIVAQRSVKSAEEIKEIERACAIGHKMHTTAMKLSQTHVTEQFLSGMITGIANSMGAMVSFPGIVTMHGEIMHGYPSSRHLESGRLLLCDAGAETNNHYCSDHTRTTPINGRFTAKQKEIYQIVEQCHDLAIKMAAPEVKWLDVHMAVATHMTEGLKQLGLMKGNTEDAVAAGAHALFMPHGLGHMMGMDVHDMEALGQQYVGFDDEVRPSTQFGLASLRMGRRLKPGFVVTDEPGIYFIPALIDQWRKNGTNADYLCFDQIEKYKDFGGVRIEDDVLITKDGARFLGKEIIPYHVDEVEEYLAKNKY